MDASCRHGTTAGEPVIELTFSSDVQQALEKNGPVVALESTLITHGLPYPQNLETARLLEQTVRDHGATPATIAILEGKACIGLDAGQLEQLAQSDSTMKCSRRDLPVAFAEKADGATTVAATMLLAHWANIEVFATGGIGGVHRGAPYDVSADLTELGRTPVTVVCAGAKAILDIPRTLEVLETFGVPVLGYRTDTFPAFYSRSSGLPVSHRCDTPQALADIVIMRKKLGLENGILVGNPIPEQDALDDDTAETAIVKALEEMEKANVRGKEVTPFLLAKVSELTGEKSMSSNISLLANNASLAAQLASHL